MPGDVSLYGINRGMNPPVYGGPPPAAGGVVPPSGTGPPGTAQNIDPMKMLEMYAMVKKMQSSKPGMASAGGGGGGDASGYVGGGGSFGSWT